MPDPSCPRRCARSRAARSHDADGERFVEERAGVPGRRQPGDGETGTSLANRGPTTSGSTPLGWPSSTSGSRQIAASLAGIGLDPAVDWLVDRPVAHHLSGGVAEDAAATLPPRPRPASHRVHRRPRREPAGVNSLEGTVFGARASPPKPSRTGGPRRPEAPSRRHAGRPATRWDRASRGVPATVPGTLIGDGDLIGIRPADEGATSSLSAGPGGAAGRGPGRGRSSATSSNGR